MVTYLGQQTDLLHKNVRLLPLKLSVCARLCTGLSTGKTAQPCQVAKLAGTLMDLAKGAVNLTGLAKILMQIAGTMAQEGWYTFLGKSSSSKGCCTR